MPEGVVKWFNAAKGYGFIETDVGEDLFVHHTAIQTEGFRALVEGERVRYEIEEGQGGKLQACNVQKL